jgi:hypothetical protein
MTKFVIRSFYFTLFFGIFFVLINVIYLGIIASTDWDFIKRLESLKFNNSDYKLVVLGASISSDAFDTELLTTNGIKSYNLAIGGSSIRTNYVQLNEYLTICSKRPQYIVLGINTKLESFDDEGIHPIVEVTMKDHKYSLKDTPILKFKWLGFEFLKKIVSKNHREAKLSYGQIKFEKTNPDKTNFHESSLDTLKIISSYWIGELARLCNENGMALLILEMPGYKETQNLSEIGPHILHFNNGVSANLYNFNSKDFCSIFDSESDWIGNSHLNEFGAKKFTKELINILEK